MVDHALRLAAIGRPAKHHGAEADLRDLDPASTQHAIAHLYHQPLLLAPGSLPPPARLALSQGRHPRGGLVQPIRPHGTLACVCDAILRISIACPQKGSPSCLARGPRRPTECCPCANDAPAQARCSMTKR